MSGENFRPSYKTCTEVTARCPVAATTYGYYPDLGPNAFFCALFGILLIVSLGIGVKTKTWSYTAFLGVGLLGEFLGYIGRIMMHANPWNSSAFQVGHYLRLYLRGLTSLASNLLSRAVAVFCRWCDLPHHEASCPVLRTTIFEVASSALPMGLHWLRSWLDLASGRGWRSRRWCWQVFQHNTT